MMALAHANHNPRLAEAHPAFSRSLSASDMASTASTLSQKPTPPSPGAELRRSAAAAACRPDSAQWAEHAPPPASPQPCAPRPNDNALQVPLKGFQNGTTNGSLISFGNVQLMHSSIDLNDSSIDGDQSRNSPDPPDFRKHLISVGRTLQKTHIHLKRTRLLHMFYFLALPVYTLLGAVVFHALERDAHPREGDFYRTRCLADRQRELSALEELCLRSGHDCFVRLKAVLSAADRCYHDMKHHADNVTVNHPMSDFTNAVVYAFSVYTSIGYGTVSATTVSARVATVIYAALGIPLFFAFVKEEGNQCRVWFIRVYNYVNRWRRHKCRQCCWVKSAEDECENQAEHLTLRNCCEDIVKEHGFMPTGMSFDSQWISAADQRRLFVASVLVFVVYLLMASYIYSVMARWDYFTSFYFTFSSVALIGFGDVYPSDPRIILANMVFIVIGVVLFSMCYFILQEEIRAKAFEASRRARMSISKYSHSLLLHTRPPWSRRNSPAFDQTSSNNSSKFERHRKRRQSAPAITVN